MYKVISMKKELFIIGMLLGSTVLFAGCTGSSNSNGQEDQATQTTQAPAVGDTTGGGEPMGLPPEDGGGPGGPDGPGPGG